MKEASGNVTNIYIVSLSSAYVKWVMQIGLYTAQHKVGLCPLLNTTIVYLSFFVFIFKVHPFGDCGTGTKPTF